MAPRCCRCSHSAVIVLGAAFWATGAAITAFMGYSNLFILSVRADDAAGKEWFWPWVALAAGVLTFAVFYGPCIFIPLAFSEIERICTIAEPHAGHFFHKWRLLALVICIPCLTVLDKHFEHIYVADLLYGGSVTPVSLGLLSGTVILLLRAWRGNDPSNDNDICLLGDDDDRV